jgi:hypothetical protein
MYPYMRVCVRVRENFSKCKLCQEVKDRIIERKA